MSTFYKDYNYYVGVVLEYLKKNKDRFPTIHETIHLVDEETYTEFAIGLGSLILWHFNRNHAIWFTAQEVENAAREAKERSFLIMATEGTTVH